MKREFLEKLGMEKEAIDSIMAEHGKSVEAQKSKVTDLTTTNADLQTQIEQRDKDIKELKKDTKDNEDLQTKLTALETQYKTDKEAYAQKIANVQLSSALKLALANQVHDTDLTIGQIDKTKIQLDADGNITGGLDDQLKELKTSKAFLFVPEAPATPNVRGATPAGTNGGGEANTATVAIDFAKAANEKGAVGEGQIDPWS